MPHSTFEPEPLTPPEGSPAPTRGGLRNDGPVVAMVGFDKDDAFNWGIFLLAFLVAFSIHAVVGVGANRTPLKKKAERIDSEMERVRHVIKKEGSRQGSKDEKQKTVE